jgi:hypothetical protein
MTKIKRLYFDLETSPNIGFFWTAGYKLNIQPDNIIQERAIICVCYKWEGESKIHSIEWNKGCDKKLLQQFIKVINSADEVVGQNSDNFDIKWLRTRCLYHGIQAIPVYNSVDTYKLAKQYFRFNSNKLDYMADFMGYGNKSHTTFELWKKIVLENNPISMAKMVAYCKKDVVLLEKVHQNMKLYVKQKTHTGVLIGHDKATCPSCGSESLASQGYKYTAAGNKVKQMQCRDCHHWSSINLNVYNKAIKDK